MLRKLNEYSDVIVAVVAVLTFAAVMVVVEVTKPKPLTLEQEVALLLNKQAKVQPRCAD